MNKYQVFVFSFLCYTSIHALRTTYSSAKQDIANQISIDVKYMGIIDALMLVFLGIGHFIHALHPIKKPVKSLWIAVILCGLDYGLISLCMKVSFLRNIFVLAVLMSINGFLQSFTWPNLLMVVHSKFNPAQDAMLLGFWASNANIGNIIGYGIFQVLNSIKQSNPDIMVWMIGLTVSAVYAVMNGVYILSRFEELPIAGAKQVRQKSIIIYQQNNQRLSRKASQLGQKVIFSSNNLQQHLFDAKSVKSGISVKSAQALFDNRSIGGMSRSSIKTLKHLNDKLSVGSIKSLRLVDQPQKVAETPLSVTEVFKDPNVVLLTITFSLSKSVIYGIMLWLPLYFKSRPDLKPYSGRIPMAYDVAAIFGSIGIGYLFKKIVNKGLLMIPFMIVLFACFFLLKFATDATLAIYFIIIATVGFALGGIFNTLSGLVVMQLTKVIPDNLKTSSLGFYSALTMAVGNITTALTQILIGFVIGKQNQQSIFIVFMAYAAICLVCLIFIAMITIRQSGQISKGQVVVIEQVNEEQGSDDGDQKPQFLKDADNNAKKIVSIQQDSLKLDN